MSVIFRRALGALALVSIASTSVAVDYGRTQGSFDVSSSGAASYTIPIWTPPGPNGLTPSLSLSYISQAGNGIAGIGWNLNAASSIERCGRTQHQDSYAAAVDLSMGDRFCIGGNRLRLSSGSYGAPGSVYFTEIADFSRITAAGTAGNGPEHFTVEAKSGLKYEYGNTPTSRVMLGGTALRWMLNKVYDRNGNNYVVSYNNATGFAVPDVISWTPTYWGSLNYRYEAQFNYNNTRTDEDSYIGKVAGLDVTNRYRLENIQIKSIGSVVRKFRFSYDTSSATSRSRLTSAKECADDAESNCLLPLTFGYQTGQTGVVTTASSGGSTGSSLYAGKYDFNGDGRSDLLYVTGSTWKVAFSTASGVGPAVNTGVSSSATFLVQRFLANHQDGLLVNVGDVWNYFRYTGSTFVSTSTDIPVPTGTVSGGETKATDNNGDGIADLVWAIGGAVMIRLNTATAGATVPTFGSASTAISFTVGSGNVAIIDAQKCPMERKCDVNGDGRADLIANVVSVSGCGQSGCTTTNTKYDLHASGSGYSSFAQTGAIGYTGILFNDDRCIDRIPNTPPAILQVSGCNNGLPTTLTLPAAPILVLDWNGDGKSDLLVNNEGYFGVYLSRGSTASPFSTLISTSVPIPTGCSPFAFDLDGDGFDDIGCVGTTSPFAVSYYTHNGSGGALLTQQPDLLNSFTDGYGVNISPSYVSTSQSNYTRGTGIPASLVDATDPIVVVAQVTNSNGIGGTYNKTYSYVGARVDAARGDFAGFQRIDETDSRNSLIKRMYFEQTFPIAGMVNQQEIMQPDGVTTISRIVYFNKFEVLSSAIFNQRYFPYPKNSTATQHGVGGTWNGSLLRTVTAENAFEFTGGLLYDKTVTTTEPASGANGVTAGGSWVERTHMPIANLVNDATNWCLGRPGKIEQINSHNLSYGTAITRNTDIVWNAAYCRPTFNYSELGTPLQVTTEFGYDDFGNVVGTQITGYDMPTRSTSAIYADATYTTGQFPLSEKNALNQTSTSEWDYDLGVPTSITDANGVAISWGYDSFGRRNRETRPDGTATTWTILSCSSISGGLTGPNHKTGVIESLLNATGAYVTDSWVCLDAFDRPALTSTRLVSGGFNRVDSQYDSLGRLFRVSAPCRWGACTNYWVTNSYDIVDRLTQVSRPFSDSDPTLQYSHAYYEGLTTRAVDAQTKQSTRVVNAHGQLARSQDHDGYYQAFDYDAFGAPKRVQDSAGNTLQSSTYNVRGMLTVRTDMDMGSWSFTPNALGEIVSQTDAKNQTMTFEFDLLGRLKKRIEPEGASEWIWGVSSAIKNIGRLYSVTGPGYSETYEYDSLGRPMTTWVSADASYQIDYSYNDIGALDSLTYPTSTDSFRLKLKYEYQFGQPYRIRDFADTPTPVNYWTANATNARGQITKETLGNNLITSRNYDWATGLMGSIQTGLNEVNYVQDYSYEWDSVGNLKKRKDKNQSSLTEEFFYDNLHRLDYSQRNGVTNLEMAYDAMGNVDSKSDVGSYTYHATKKHQVASTSNGWSFGYDGNGNMTSGRGRSISWTSYNYPLCVTSGTDCTGTTSDYSKFSYAPNRQYWKQESNFISGGSATTLYIGNLLEKVSTSAGDDYRYVIRAGGSTIIVSRRTAGLNPNNSYYVTSDHLGSASAITDGSGNRLVNESFDAFGKRRGSNWSGGPSEGDWTDIASTTRRGYTDHTMLDNLGLIHMNGRVQDPVLGRFASADPLITEPGNTQNYNRYSYVYNNPLSFADPTGFCAEGEVLVWDSNNQEVDSSAGYKAGFVSALGVAVCVAQVVVQTVRRGCLTNSPGMCSMVDIARYAQRVLANNTAPLEEVFVVRNGNIEIVPQKSTNFDCSDGSGYTENTPADPAFDMDFVSIYVHRHPSSGPNGEFTFARPGPRDGRIAHVFNVPVIGVSDVGGWVIMPGPPMHADLLFDRFGPGFEKNTYDRELNKGAGDVNKGKTSKVSCKRQP